ncbi:uncharacterized protein UV8b_06587 [Ustilaginoidea virens]|uniref:Uncharacterized protein n=1 Tax=Ustilaginoidea virens TaxID=1159556 RepID=A0A8E5HVL5_USTVR|nr:uncharacterized protein UV8b_06587 [Ustilaginoidea virens]QUC22346.1 hypothetical protein UV8b_06587 [Ustilaginoidea virens]
MSMPAVDQGKGTTGTTTTTTPEPEPAPAVVPQASPHTEQPSPAKPMSVDSVHLRGGDDRLALCCGICGLCFLDCCC